MQHVKFEVILVKQVVKAYRVVRRRSPHIFQTVGSQMAVRLSALRVVYPLFPGRFLVISSVTGWVDTRTIVRPEPEILTVGR
jgi:hypothetical protein